MTYAKSKNIWKHDNIKGVGDDDQIKYFRINIQYVCYVNSITYDHEIRFYAYLYASSFLVLWHIIFETTAQIPEVELGGKYGYMRYLPWVQITNTDF
jgi:hypothetical protein